MSGSFSEQLTYTNNIDLSPRETRESDFVVTLTPRVQVSYDAARASLNGWIAVPVNLAVRTGSDNNTVAPQANLNGNVEVVKDLFFVDAAANVSQTYYDPFGPQPPDFVNATANRYTSQSYRISPYLQGQSGSALRYSLRNDNIWTNLGGAPQGATNAYSNILTGVIDRDPTPVGWGADLRRAEYDFADQERSQRMQLARLRGAYRSSLWQVTLSGGYESNKFTLTESEEVIYGIAFSWRPSNRTHLDAAWEHRFFGESYRVKFQHRGPRYVFDVGAYRDVSTYPEQVTQLAAGSFLPGVLNEILQSRIVDPAERAQFIANYIRDRGLPDVLASPISIYSQRIYLVENASAGFGVIGARNNLFFTAYHVKTQPITASGEALPGDPSSVNNSTQIGGAAAWTYALTPTASLSVSGHVGRTDANPPFEGRSDFWTLRLGITRPISAKTTTFAGARYQKFDSDIHTSYTEAAVFVGASHSFE
ncbi:MAG: TIGR03016 family PEP-CTERM system-associated outer membrane protein [Gammaproteobacteria bacterium]|nr:TIGR03016 family PEP-CTERM system-associated outer membrane protein [Gammaproteobacteria bacterium]